MTFNMRLFRKRGWYHVEVERNRSLALRTKDEEEANNLFLEMEKEHLRGRLFKLDEVKRVTLSDFKKKYVEYRENLSDLSIETIKKDKLSLKLLADIIGSSTLIRIIKLDEFKNKCLSRGAKKLTINGYLRHLKTAFKWGVKEGYLEKMPEIIMYKRLKKQESELLDRILEPDEIKNLEAKAYERSAIFGIYCHVVLWTGGRRREGLNLEWQKIDFKNNRLTLRGKTGSRTIPMLAQVKKVLKPIKKDIGRVFPDWHPDTVSHWFQTAATDAGIEGHRLHDLRHTCATYLLKNNVPLNIVQQIMGHANISTTQIYAKVLQDVMQFEMKKLKFK